MIKIVSVELFFLMEILHGERVSAKARCCRHKNDVNIAEAIIEISKICFNHNIVYHSFMADSAKVLSLL